MGTSLPHFKPVYGNSPRVSSKKKQMCAGVISSVEISSRSLGLFCGLLVSQGRSSPASCRFMSSGSSVRKRIRPCRRTVLGRFSIFRFNRASITTHHHYFTPLGRRVVVPALLNNTAKSRQLLLTADG